MKGKKITTLQQLVAASTTGKAVVVNYSSRDIRMPAAFVASMQGRYIHGLFQRGMWIYKK